MSVRFERANSELQRCIADIIQNKMNDPRISPMLYISEVNVTPDFRFCKVKVALDSEDEQELKEIIKVLEKSEGFIKRELAQMVNMPHMPKLQFLIDKGTQATVRINEILKNLNKEEKK
ncbi:MAG: 30S ribosome-binding factor RbfA [Clostridia bacterium]|jgi:ribosome-binding factor A|nr:30S ribosome-binding factor RbfA [Clostridia bacterium]